MDYGNEFFDFDFCQPEPNVWQALDDTTGDGVIDTIATSCDWDGDGILDQVYLQVDTNGDATIDTIISMLDSTGNGQMDTAEIQMDTTHDGVLDTEAVVWDTTGDGHGDTLVMAADTIGNYQQDTVIRGVDTNADGKLDLMTIHQDTDADGQVDTTIKLYDSTGDGEMDMARIFQDLTDDGRADVDQIVSIADWEDWDGSYAGGIGGTMSYELDNFEPAEDYPADIVGDPAASMEEWECQGETNRCALYAQKFVIQELTGQEVDIEDIVAYAEENGIFTENGGTSMLNTNRILEHYGIENEMNFHSSVDDIEDCLNNGGRVIVGIDANQIWFGKDLDVFSPETGANHAVEVIGIDNSDPDNPMVILNDSGNPDGKGEMIPMDVFLDSWEAGDCQMIACYPPAAAA